MDNYLPFNKIELKIVSLALHHATRTMQKSVVIYGDNAFQDYTNTP